MPQQKRRPRCLAVALYGARAQKLKLIYKTGVDCCNTASPLDCMLLVAVASGGFSMGNNP